MQNIFQGDILRAKLTFGEYIHLTFLVALAELSIQDLYANSVNYKGVAFLPKEK